MELHEALAQIETIRAHAIASGAAGRFRGYRSGPVATSGLLAVVAAMVQPAWVPSPERDVGMYLALWLTTAVVGGGIAASGLWLTRRLEVPSVRHELTRLAVGQFVPCLAAGALVTVAVARHAPASAHLLPGLWQVFFSLGIFASCRLLPRPVVAVAFFYLLCGTLNLCGGAAFGELAPLAMGLPFAVGQLATAAILYWHLERGRGT